MTRTRIDSQLGVINLTAEEEAAIDAEELAEEDFLTQSKIEANRVSRNAKLASSDWTQMPDITLTNKDEWLTYRQALRDLPTHSNWPNLEDSDWPTKPEA
tara:strand:- start:459 stop:758 length:300 start_codon:yes stop_codon:yes gene_type:complete